MRRIGKQDGNFLIRICLCCLSEDNEDPCIGGARKFAQAVQTMRRIGYMDTKGKLYPGMRHEILNEREKEKVYHDVKKYIEKKLNI